jgi:hypothetical protein
MDLLEPGMFLYEGTHNRDLGLEGLDEAFTGFRIERFFSKKKLIGVVGSWF